MFLIIKNRNQICKLQFCSAILNIYSDLFLGQVPSDVLKFCIDADRSVSYECVLLFF